MTFKAPVILCIACFCLQAAEHRGVVRSNGLAIPGATVTAVQGDKKLVTFTDENGNYLFRDLPPGDWKVQAEIMGFQQDQRELKVSDAAPPLELELKLKTPAMLAAAASAPKPVEAAKAAEVAKADPVKTPEAPKAAPAPRQLSQRGAANGRQNGAQAGPGFQQLAVNQTLQNDVQAALSAAPEMVTADMSQNANESFLVSGSLSRGLQDAQREDMFSMMRGGEDMRQRMEQMRSGMGGGMDGGGMGGPGGGGPGGGG